MEMPRDVLRMAGFENLSHKHCSWQGQAELPFPREYVTRSDVRLKGQCLFVEKGKKRLGSSILPSLLAVGMWE